MYDTTVHTELTDETGFVLPVEFRIEFDYEPHQRQTRDCPGNPETVNVYAASVWLGPLNLGPHPYPKSLEHLVWEQRERERADAAENIAERRAA